MSKIKTLASAVLAFQSHKNKADWTSASESLNHPTIVEELRFEIREKQDRSKFEMKIHARCIHESPCFRFESAGATHLNLDPGIPLIERKVPPPHFHRFNDRGHWIAYHTEALKDPITRDAMSQKIELSLTHFFEESRIKTPGKTTIRLLPVPVVLEFWDDTKGDLHAGAKFP